jgi:hypothetical protein
VIAAIFFVMGANLSIEESIEGSFDEVVDQAKPYLFVFE